jgi:hypothetical protein
MDMSLNAVGILTTIASVVSVIGIIVLFNQKSKSIISTIIYIFLLLIVSLSAMSFTMVGLAKLISYFNFELNNIVISGNELLMSVYIFYVTIGLVIWFRSYKNQYSTE